MRATRRPRHRPHLPPRATPHATLPLGPAEVDRLLWRAGYGPTAADRAAWIGRRWFELVDHLLDTPGGLLPGAVPTVAGAPIDPLASETQLELEWLDRMVRATNPLVERLAFFWARHWAISVDGGVTIDYARQYVSMLRRYADLATSPTATVRDLANAVGQSPAMLRYLNGDQNTRTGPNENYGREFMELFTLGVTDDAGAPNYTETDVRELARAFTGWTVNTTDPANPVGTFIPGRADTGAKTILGQTGAFTATQAVDVVLGSPKHAPFLARRLWHEFIVTEPDDATLAALVAAYTAGGRLAIRPLVRRILLDPAIFESLAEPNMIKPPVVYAVGVVRATGAPLADTWQTASLVTMGQEPYNPPNVAGWEGGLSWLSTNAAQARFDFAVRCLHLVPAPVDVPAETPADALARAIAAVGGPWLAPASREHLLAIATAAPTTTTAQRLGRQHALRALVLGGPDGQVM
jgi:uncharacterized protein (DUF1800 family)